ncbi:MAG: copper amine oxidase N-terminal domain-containing protein [Lysinibacillus sp.]
MKRNIPFALTFALMAGSVAPAAFADGPGVPAAEEKKESGEAEQVQGKFIKLTGTFRTFEERPNGSLYALIEQGEHIYGIIVDEKSAVLDNAGNPIELEEGMAFTAYVDADKPMIMIYPPQYVPELIIVQTKEQGFVEVDQFDENFAGEKLKLNITSDTVIENLSGTKLEAKAIADADAAIFYTTATKSIPAHVEPSKVLVLSHDGQDEGFEAVQDLIAGDFYEVDGVKMVPLRLVAEELGWKVESTGKGAVVSKGGTSFTITRGETSYVHDGQERRFEVAPALLEPIKTYVPVDFVDYLVKE